MLLKKPARIRHLLDQHEADDNLALAQALHLPQVSPNAT